MATLAALDLAKTHPAAQLAVYTFGQPRVGNRAFAQEYNRYVPHHFSVINDQVRGNACRLGCMLGMRGGKAHAQLPPPVLARDRLGLLCPLRPRTLWCACPRAATRRRGRRS